MTVPISFKSKETDATKIHPAIFQAITTAAWSVWGHLGATELIVTALRDGSHRVGSRHKQEICTAVDIRSRSLPTEEAKFAARDELQAVLGKSFKVLYENPGEPTQHIHVSYIADGKAA